MIGGWRLLDRGRQSPRNDETTSDQPKTDGDDTSDAFEEGNARQNGPGFVQGPRAAARHAWQPPRVRAREVAEHPQRLAVGPEIAVRGFDRAGDTGRA